MKHSLENNKLVYLPMIVSIIVGLLSYIILGHGLGFIGKILVGAFSIILALSGTLYTLSILIHEKLLNSQATIAIKVNKMKSPILRIICYITSIILLVVFIILLMII